MDRLPVKRAVGGSSSRTIRTSLRQPGDISEHLKRLIEGRDNEEIISFLEESEQSSDSHEHFKVERLITFNYPYNDVFFPEGCASADNFK